MEFTENCIEFQLSEEQKDRLRASFAKNVGSTRGNSGQIRTEQMEVNNG